MKKILLTTLIASMLIVPLGNTALAGHEEDALPVSAQDFVPGDTPAGNAAPEAMLPAVHGLILAMLNHDADEFDRTDTALAWESLYNMLSLYGELDSRCDESNGELFLLEETVRDYASALGIQLDELGPLPEELWDRINYDNASQGYILVCGETPEGHGTVPGGPGPDPDGQPSERPGWNDPHRISDLPGQRRGAG